MTPTASSSIAKGASSIRLPPTPPRSPSHTRIIGLGNTILSDDGVGVYAARELERRCAGRPGVDVVESEVAGFDLIELMEGHARIILIDAISFDDLSPGSVVRIDPSDLRTSLRIRSVHEIDLPTALGLGRQLGLAMPEEIVIFGIQVEDPWTLGERLNERVERGMHQAIEQVMALLDVEEGPCTSSR